jgi:TolB-like protein/tRNA A-37 threonylcarbamoyl transferase component Bud32/Flp pilus assembly protein TadD
VPLATGLRLGPYEVMSPVGAGGMGEVYRARDTRLDRIVAIKVLHPQVGADERLRLRFEREARLVAGLNHPHICTLFDVGQQDGLQYLVMEFLEGQTLEAKARAGPIHPAAVHGYARQLASALAAAHARAVIHRDIKPSNLFLTDESLVKVLDFGIALEAMVPNDAETKARTAQGVFIGTMAYASPEQLRSETVDERSDIFSLGVVLHELLTGRSPFARKTSIEEMGAILHEDPPPLPSGIPLPLAFAVTRCLAKRPQDRFQSARELQQQLDATPAAATRAAPSIAVLPFADLSPKRDQEYLCDGLADELITALMGLEGVRVASRTSAFQFKGKSDDVAEIGRRLRVNTVLEGTVRVAGPKIRVTVRLTDVAEGFQVWTERYDRPLDDIFAVEDEIAHAVVQRLKVTLTSDAPLVVPGTTNMEAYALYLKGRHELFKHDLINGMASINAAIEMQPDYAEAHAILALGYMMMSFANLPPRQVMPMAKAAAGRALELNPNLADGLLALGTVQHWYDWDWAGAEESYRKAIALSPGNANARFNYSELLTTRGRFDEAIIEAARAIELDPVTPFSNRAMADALFISGQFEKALSQTYKIRTIDPTYFANYWPMGLALASLGRYGEAVEALEFGRKYAYGDPNIEGFIGYAAALGGDHDKARAIIADLEARRATGFVSGGTIAIVYQGLGDLDAAMPWYETAVDDRSGECALYWNNPVYTVARRDARFKALIARVENGDPGGR